jgi:hypothetical protein
MIRSVAYRIGKKTRAKPGALTPYMIIYMAYDWGGGMSNWVEGGDGGMWGC